MMWAISWASSQHVVCGSPADLDLHSFVCSPLPAYRCIGRIALFVVCFLLRSTVFWGGPAWCQSLHKACLAALLKLTAHFTASSKTAAVSVMGESFQSGPGVTEGKERARVSLTGSICRFDELIG